MFILQNFCIQDTLVELLDWLNLAMLLSQILGEKGFNLPMDIENSFNLRLGYLMPYHARLVWIRLE